MDFALTDEQRQIRDAAQSFLADVSDSAAVRKAAESVQGYDTKTWQRLGAELGWCGIAIAEAHGGLGLGPVELMLVQEQCGRRLLCAPFFSTVCLAANVLQACASAAARAQYLPQLAQGNLLASVPLVSTADGWMDPAAPPQAHRHGLGWRLESDALRIPEGASAELFFIFASIDETVTGLFAVPRGAKGVAVTPQRGWDATRRFAAVELRGVELGAQQRVDDAARHDAERRSAALARLYIAAEQLGGAQACLDLTVAYTLTRKQFGRSVASFQAVKHRCAEMMVRVEALRSAVYGAAAFAADAAAAGPLELECAMARSLAADTFFFCAQEAIQLHGGVGFTWEYDPQLYFKRAQAGSHWLGGAEALRGRIADLLMADTGSKNANRIAA